MEFFQYLFIGQALYEPWNTNCFEKRLPKFMCATLDCSDPTISQALPSYQIIVLPKALWSDHSATQETVQP